MLGLPIPPAGKSSYNIPCPCCDDKPKGKHLNINLRKDVFRCPRCGFAGGVLDLYAHYARIPRENALKELLSRRGIAGASRRPALFFFLSIGAHIEQEVFPCRKKLLLSWGRILI